MKTLNNNYKRNVEIMRENLKRGMSAGQAVSVIKNWHKQFVNAGLYGQEEKDFLNECLALVEEETHMAVVLM